MHIDLQGPMRIKARAPARRISRVISVMENGPVALKQ